MRRNSSSNVIPIVILCVFLFLGCFVSLAEEEKEGFLPSWNDVASKNTVLDYVKNITSTDSDTFLEKEKRIAVFRDNGTLIAENPSVQKEFLLRSLKRLAKKQPVLLEGEPFKSAEEKGMEYIDKLDAGMLRKIGGIIREEAGEEFYKELISDFLNTAKHPHFDVLYKDLIYQPMKELLSYLRAMDFSVYIVSSGDTAFVKSVSEALYGRSPERIISFNELKADPNKKPIFAAGRINEGQDAELLLYCQSNELPSLQMLIKHDDNERELMYGQNDQMSFDAAKNNGWIQVSMKNDWKNIFPLVLKEQAPPKELKRLKDKVVEE
ncbi:MAG: hypothetical protein WBD00_00595, partial [Candidatus Omnitrophota bacterium]